MLCDVLQGISARKLRKLRSRNGGAQHGVLSKPLLALTRLPAARAWTRAPDMQESPCLQKKDSAEVHLAIRPRPDRQRKRQTLLCHLVQARSVLVGSSEQTIPGKGWHLPFPPLLPKLSNLQLTAARHHTSLRRWLHQSAPQQQQLLRGAQCRCMNARRVEPTAPQDLREHSSRSCHLLGAVHNRPGQRPFCILPLPQAP
mmetsp:Transcript_2152/g.5454  ORF Transcript_2152/g.5454 Transcript_2152/m.5454 type:complete len:200 (+) Transcript_2152:1002-1601(+)